MTVFCCNRKGFTLVELMVVMAIIALMITYSVINLTSIQSTTYVATTVNTFVADLRQQQLKSMIGDTEGRADSDSYGVYLQPTEYVLFHGSSYSPLDTSNAAFPLDNNMQISATTFPQSTIIFSQGTGEVAGFIAGQNTVTLRNTVTGEVKEITINKYGVITQIN